MANLFWPMFALFIWTILVSLRNLQVRVAAMRARQVRESYFEIFSGEAPEEVIKVGNNLRNLTEFPPLFYVAVLLILATGSADTTFLWLAWAYVGLRVLHSAVHLSFNKVKPRFAMFIASQLVLITMWAKLALQIAG